MDPDLMVGIVNTSLRNHFDDLDDLCLTHNLDSESLNEKLRSGGYEYPKAARQFR